MSQGTGNWPIDDDFAKNDAHWFDGVEEGRSRRRHHLEEENGRYLEGFGAALLAAGCSPEAARARLDDAALFLNGYLLEGEPVNAIYGCERIGDFLGSSFAPGCGAASADARACAESLRGFYGFMLGEGLVSQDDYDDLLYDIRDFFGA